MLIAAALISIPGCGDSLGLSPVSGAVTLDGKPLADATVTFTPLEGSGDRLPSVGTTDSQGRYILWTEGETGALPGRHAVSVVIKPQLAEGESLPDDRSEWKLPETPVPDQYANPENSGLSFSVPPEGSDKADFALESKKK
jgi:hypothetical protein